MNEDLYKKKKKKKAEISENEKITHYRFNIADKKSLFLIHIFSFT